MNFTKRQLELELVKSRYEFDFDVSLDDFRKYFIGCDGRRKRGGGKPKKGEVGLFEFGIHRNRFDLIKVDCYRRKVKGYEFKVSRGDFKSDKKWPHYLGWCNSLTFVCPKDLIKKEELPSNVGILYIFKYRWHPERFYKERFCKWSLGTLWERKARFRDISVERYIEIISLLLNRAKWRKEDIF